MFASLFMMDSFCDGCKICLPNAVCLPNCNFTSFYDLATNQCINCMETCKNGCISNSSCSLCSDPFCTSCFSQSTRTCYSCIDGYELLDSQCVVCNSSSYFDESTRICNSCSELCVSCNANGCLKCQEDFFLNSTFQCTCSQGYYSSNNTCARLHFTAVLLISSDNLLTIKFSHPLSKTLETAAITISVNSKLQDFTISRIDPSEYTISVNYSETIHHGDQLHLLFNSPLLSTENYLLETTELVATLFSNESTETELLASTIAFYAKILFIIGTSVSLCVAGFNFKPSSFFTFLNAAEIYVYVLIFNMQLDPLLYNFLNMLQASSYIPNMFEYFISPGFGNPAPDKFSNFGNPSNLILINSGSTLTLFSVIVTLNVIAFLMPLVQKTWIRAQILKFKQNFKYSAYLRFYLQSFLELLVTASYAVAHNYWENVTQIVDFTLSVCILVRIT
jgi:hypothetical protein